MRKGVLLLATLLILVSTAAYAFEPIIFKDPKGDDKGPGSYTYPTAPEYKPGSFDLREVQIRDKGDKVEIKVKIAARIEDPWDSKSWTPPGRGFSLQFIQIYVDKDHKPGSGHKKGLPGLNILFKDESRWEKVILISPQPVSRIKAEIKQKAKEFEKDIIIPRKITVSGKWFKVYVPKKELGEPTKEWGWQVIMQSNEGYPDATDLLTRDVNEVAGEHRFGGGSDWDCDPHVIDILVSPAKGTKEEIQKQYKALSYKCAGSDLSKAKLAELPMVYPGK